MNVVAVGAHPDDVEVVLGGTLLRYGAEGKHRLTVLVVSNGARGVSATVGPREIVAVRDGEAKAAASLLGAEYVNLGFPDGELADTRECRSAITDVLRAADAEVVFGPPADDYNPDHVAVSSAVTAACLWASAPGWDGSTKALARTPTLYYTETIGGFGEQPTLFIDISPVIDRKLELLRVHRSQARLGEEHFGSDLVDIATRTSSFRGLQAGVRHAEGVRPALSWPRVQAGVGLPGGDRTVAPPVHPAQVAAA